MKIQYLFFLVLIFLSSCKPNISFDKFVGSGKTITDNVDNSIVKVDDILKGRSLIAVANGNKLFLVDPDFAKPFELYQFAKDEIPVNKAIDNFFVSPNKKWIIWYSPVKGVVGLNIKLGKTQIIHEATDFLNTNSFFKFLSTNVLLFITSNGNELSEINLENMERKTINIPYPYGNVFKVSPDEKSILFVSGYGQAVNKPKFMFMDIEGRFSNQFSAQINLFDRNLVFWAPDSTGVFMINSFNLEYYPIINPEEKNVMFTLGKDNPILSAQRINNTIFIYSKKEYWHIFDYETQKEIARTPTSIAKELNNPKFIPWSISQFLIEETIEDQQLTFNRLWLSDFRGNKKIVMDRYNELIVETETQVVE